MSAFRGRTNYWASSGGIAIGATHECVCSRSSGHDKNFGHLCPCGEQWEQHDEATAAELLERGWIVLEPSE